MKLRYIAALAVSAASVMATPACIRAAEVYRGYEALFGGEHLVIPLGIIVSVYILHIASLIDGVLDRLRVKKACECAVANAAKPLKLSGSRGQNVKNDWRRYYDGYENEKKQQA